MWTGAPRALPEVRLTVTLDQKPRWAEADRLAVLRGYDILDTPREAAFDDIVDLVAGGVGAPRAGGEGRTLSMIGLAR